MPEKKIKEGHLSLTVSDDEWNCNVAATDHIPKTDSKNSIMSLDRFPLLIVKDVHINIFKKKYRSL